MIRNFFIFCILFSYKAWAIVGLESLESKLVENNSELSSLKRQVEANEFTYKSGRSGFYPTINIVGGWAQNRTDDLIVDEKGAVGYIEGRYNLFNGFKDQSALQLKNVDLELTKIELEFKKRELRLELTEIIAAIIQLHNLKDISAEELKITQIQKQMAAKKVGAGLTGSVDNLEFSLRESEILIERNQIEQLHTEAHQKLFKIYGENITDEELTQLAFSKADELAKSVKVFVIENNLNYQKSKFNILKAELEKKEIIAEFKPKLDFTFSVGRLTPSELSPIKFDESEYGITLTVPFFSGLETFYKTRAATQQIFSADRLKLQRISDINSEFNILKSKAVVLNELYNINDIKLANSLKYYNLTNAEYKRGVKNSPDLVGATERWFSSKKKKYEILKDLEILKIKIENL